MNDSTDAELDALLARAARVDDAAAARLARSAGAAELMEQIMADRDSAHVDLDGEAFPLSPLSPVSPAAPDVVPVALRGRRRRAGITLAAAATVAAVLVGSWALPDGRGASTQSVVPAAEPGAADAGVLVGRDGWAMTRADFDGEPGEVTFAGEGRTLDVHWRPAQDFQSYLDDRRALEAAGTVSVLGQDGETFHYSGGDYATILPVHGATFLEIRGDLGDLAGYRALLATLRYVGTQEWLAAMPASTVPSADRDRVVAEMLRGVTTPAGFDPASIPAGGAAEDRYQLGASVTGSVACAWLGVWSAAKQGGDAAAADAAASAVQGSRSWPVLREMEAEGAYPQVVAEAGDLMAGDSPDAKVDPDDVEAVRTWVTQGLGCDSR